MATDAGTSPVRGNAFPSWKSSLSPWPEQGGWRVIHLIRATGERSVIGLMRLADKNFCPWRLGRNAGDFLCPPDR